MASSTSLPLLFLLLLLLLLLRPGLSHATTFDIINQCPYTVWAAAVPGGGRQLERGQNWTLDVEPGTPSGRIWARTGCSFDSSGHGHCDTGDCGGLLACRSQGSPPNTNAEFALNQFDDMDFFDISLINGFNVPMEFGPKSGSCRGIRCSADIVGRCPERLKAPGGCHNPCTVFKTDQYCCMSGRCEPTNYSQFFKRNCPTSYSFPLDEQTNSFTCPGGTNYKVVFCPQEIGHVFV